MKKKHKTNMHIYGDIKVKEKKTFSKVKVIKVFVFSLLIFANQLVSGVHQWLFTIRCAPNSNQIFFYLKF